MHLLFGVHPVLFCHEMQGVVERAQDEVFVDNVATVEANQLTLGDWTDGEQALTLNVWLPHSNGVVLKWVHQGGISPKLMVGGGVIGQAVVSCGRGQRSLQAYNPVIFETNLVKESSHMTCWHLEYLTDGTVLPLLKDVVIPGTL